MAARPKMSIKELAQQIKSADPDLNEIPDDVLVRKVLERRPQMLNLIQTSEPRQTLSDSKLKRFGRGMAGMLTEGVEGLIKSSFESGRHSEDIQRNPKTGELLPDKERAAALIKDQAKLSVAPIAGLGESIKSGSIIDIPGIKKDIKSGDYAGAAGRGTTQALMIISLIENLMKGGLAKGGAKSSALGEFKELTDLTSAPLRATLDEQIAGIDKAMANQYINNQRLSAGTAWAKKAIEKIDRAPGVTRQMDVTAAKNVVDQLGQRMKAGKTMPWADARRMYKDIGKAAFDLPTSDLKDKLFEIRDALKDELSSSAKKAGEPGFDKWVKDYADLSDLDRRFSKVLKGQTEAQLETKATAKSAPSLRVAGTTPVRFGRTRAGKIAAQNKEMIKKAYAAYDELHKRIKTPPPFGQKPAPAPPPTSVAPTGGGPTGTPAAPTQGTPAGKPPTTFSAGESDIDQATRRAPIQPTPAPNPGAGTMLGPQAKPPGFGTAPVPIEESVKGLMGQEGLNRILKGIMNVEEFKKKIPQ